MQYLQTDLHHVVSLSSQTSDMSVDINALLMTQTLNHAVDDDEATGTSDACTAVYNNRARVLRVTSTHTTKELKEGGRMIWHTVVWPRSEL